MAPPDPFYRNAKQHGYRARSAYKLLEIDEEFNIFENVSAAVDLCAAPGSWSQVIRGRLNGSAVKNRITPQIIAVDLQKMNPLPGVVQLTGDITRPETIDAIKRELCSSAGGDSTHGGHCQLVVCDGAPDLSGLHEFDAHLAHALAISALRAAAALLIPGGVFVLKIFLAGAGAGADGARHFAGAGSLLHAQLRALFRRVAVCKPRSSRVTSREHFAVCRGFLPPPAGPARLGCGIPARPDEVVMPMAGGETDEAKNCDDK